jgi:hypothetical protein
MSAILSLGVLVVENADVVIDSSLPIVAVATVLLQYHPAF